MVEKNEAKSKIQSIQELLNDFSFEEIEELDISTIIEFRNKFENLSDVRDSRSLHFLSDIVMIAIIAVLANANEWSEIAEFAKMKQDWLSSFLNLHNGIPSKYTIQRAISLIDSKLFYTLSLQFITVQMNELHELNKSKENNEKQAPDFIAVDGKTSKGSKRNKTDVDRIKAMHTVSFFSTENGFCVSQESVEEKTNEIPAVQDLIQITNIKDCVLTWDALNTQTKTVELVIKAKGDYVGALKGNHKNFYEDVLLFFTTECDNLRSKSNCYKKTIEKEHSSTITREYFFTQDIDWLPNKQEWLGLKSIGLEKKTIKKLNGKTTVEERLFIASIDDLNLFARAVRSQWQVENKLHWHLDYTFKDDQNTTLERNGAKNLQIIKKIALAILNIVKPLFKRSLKKIRFITSLDVEVKIETIFKCLNADGLAQLWENKRTA